MDEPQGAGVKVQLTSPQGCQWQWQ